MTEAKKYATPRMFPVIEAMIADQTASNPNDTFNLTREIDRPGRADPDADADAQARRGASDPDGRLARPLPHAEQWRRRDQQVVAERKSEAAHDEGLSGVPAAGRPFSTVHSRAHS